jgi:hypothetical protein
MPARVTSYDAAKRRVSVKPLIKESYVDGFTGERLTESVPVITDVPVAFPRGGSYRIEFPIAAGDTGWLWFADRSLDRWLASGGEVDPGDDRDHHLTDAVFYPGVQAFGAVPSTAAPDDCMSVGLDGGAVIEIDGDEVRVGGSGAVSLAKINELNNLLAAFLTHTHAVVGGSTGPPGPTTPTLPPGGAFDGTDVAKGK